jgi:hypothetical protein
MISAIYLDEPDLIFGHQQEEKDPRIGLRQFGPYFSPEEKAPTPSHIRIGIIGDGESTTLAQRTVQRLSTPIPSAHTNKWLYPNFEGFSLESRVRCDFLVADRWNALIRPQEIKDILALANVNERIASAVSLVIAKVERILAEDDTPDVIIVSLPEEIEEYCGIGDRTRGAKRPSFTDLEKQLAEYKKVGQKFLENWGAEVSGGPELPAEKGYDLRNALKGRVMALKNAVPVQILRHDPSTHFLDGTGVKDGSLIPSHYAWNVATALYYKAKGRPWRLAKLTPGTCYVGISFFVDKRDPKQGIQSSMAQVFTHSGDGFVLRGADVVIDESSTEAHLTGEQSEDLLRRVLDKYKEKAETDATRVVIHKTSGYSSGEREGFLAAIGKKAYDLVSFHADDPVRFLRYGDWPVLRGTLVTLSKGEYVLYTSGYVPRIRVYPGVRVPQPLHIRHEGASPVKLVAEEILGLTKLNWNTTTFATRLPITLEFAREVGKVLSELEPGAQVQDHYRFYM